MALSLYSVTLTKGNAMESTAIIQTLENRAAVAYRAWRNCDTVNPAAHYARYRACIRCIALITDKHSDYVAARFYVTARLWEESA